MAADTKIVQRGLLLLILVGTLAGLPLDRSIFPQPYIEPATVYRLRFESSGAYRDAKLYIPHAEAAA